MDADQESAAAAVVIGVLLKRRKSKQRKKRSVWVKPWLQRRNKLGVYHTPLQELRMEAEEEYKQFWRMSPELFDELLILVEVQVLIKKIIFLRFLIFSGHVVYLNFADIWSRDRVIFIIESKNRITFEKPSV